MIHPLYYMASALTISLAVALPVAQSSTATHTDCSTLGRRDAVPLACQEPRTERYRDLRIISTSNAKEQYVSNSEAHKFVAPSKEDRRGRCPGLKAMANHGYLPRNGIASIMELTEGGVDAFGMGADLSKLFAVYATVFGGALERYSIGRTQSDRYQADGLGRSDEGFISKFTTLYGLDLNNDSTDFTVLAFSYGERPQESNAMNPHKTLFPFRGVIDASAAWPFVHRLMANRSSEDREGYLSGDILKSFFSISGGYPDFTYTPGHERFPDNWYKRSEADTYTIQGYATDLLKLAIDNPQSHANADLEVSTDDVFSLKGISKASNLFCIAAQASLRTAPDTLSLLYNDTALPMELLEIAVADSVDGLDCHSMAG